MSFIDDYNMPTDNFRTGDNFSVRFPYGVINYKTGREPLLVANSYLGGLSGILNAMDCFIKERVMPSETAQTFTEVAEEMSLVVARVFEEPIMIMAGKVIAEAGDPLIEESFSERAFNNGKVVLHDRPLQIGSEVCNQVVEKSISMGISNPKGRLLLVTAGGLIEHLSITQHGVRFSWDTINDRDGTLLHSLALTPLAHMSRGYYAKPHLDHVLQQFSHFHPEISPIIKPNTLAHQILIDYIVEQNLK